MLYPNPKQTAERIAIRLNKELALSKPMSNNKRKKLASTLFPEPPPRTALNFIKTNIDIEGAIRENVNATVGDYEDEIHLNPVSETLEMLCLSHSGHQHISTMHTEHGTAHANIKEKQEAFLAYLNANEKLTNELLQLPGMTDLFRVSDTEALLKDDGKPCCYYHDDAISRKRKKIDDGKGTSKDEEKLEEMEKANKIIKKKIRKIKSKLEERKVATKQSEIQDIDREIEGLKNVIIKNSAGGNFKKEVIAFPAERKVLGSGLFFELSYNSATNLWLLCGGCNIAKSSKDEREYFAQDKGLFFGKPFIDHIDQLGGFEEGIVVNTINAINESGTFSPQETITCGGSTVKLYNDPRSICGIGEFTRLWVEGSHKTFYDTLKDFNAKNGFQLQECLHEIRTEIYGGDENLGKDLLQFVNQEVQKNYMGFAAKYEAYKKIDKSDLSTGAIIPFLENSDEFWSAYALSSSAQDVMKNMYLRKIAHAINERFDGLGTELYPSVDLTEFSCEDMKKLHETILSVLEKSIASSDLEEGRIIDGGIEYGKVVGDVFTETEFKEAFQALSTPDSNRHNIRLKQELIRERINEKFPSLGDQLVRTLSLRDFTLQEMENLSRRVEHALKDFSSRDKFQQYFNILKYPDHEYREGRRYYDDIKNNINQKYTGLGDRLAKEIKIDALSYQEIKKMSGRVSRCLEWSRDAREFQREFRYINMSDAHRKQLSLERDVDYLERDNHYLRQDLNQEMRYSRQLEFDKQDLRREVKYLHRKTDRLEERISQQSEWLRNKSSENSDLLSENEKLMLKIQQLERENEKLKKQNANQSDNTNVLKRNRQSTGDFSYQTNPHYANQPMDMQTISSQRNGAPFDDWNSDASYQIHHNQTHKSSRGSLGGSHDKDDPNLTSGSTYGVGARKDFGQDFANQSGVDGQTTVNRTREKTNQKNPYRTRNKLRQKKHGENYSKRSSNSTNGIGTRKGSGRYDVNQSGIDFQNSLERKRKRLNENSSGPKRKKRKLKQPENTHIKRP